MLCRLRWRKICAGVFHSENNQVLLELLNYAWNIVLLIGLKLDKICPEIQDLKELNLKEELWKNLEVMGKEPFSQEMATRQSD